MSCIDELAANAMLNAPPSRQHLMTPALVLDLDAFESSVATMSRLCKERGIALRSHAKAHQRQGRSDAAWRRTTEGAVREASGYKLFHSLLANAREQGQRHAVRCQCGTGCTACDPTVHSHDHYHCVRGDTLVDIWPIDARGPL